MQGCDKTVVITHLEYDSEQDADRETVQTFSGCSWYGQTKATVGKDGLTSASVYKCRIPQQAAGGTAPRIARGDKIQCGDTQATVIAVHDNRGRPAPHWYVEASGCA